MARRTRQFELITMLAITMTGCHLSGDRPFRLDSTLKPKAGKSASASMAATASGDAASQTTQQKTLDWKSHPLFTQNQASTTPIERIRSGANRVVSAVSNELHPSNNDALDPTNLQHQAGPVQPNLHLSAARMMEQNGQLDAAARHYSQLLAITPNDRNGLIGLARVNHRMGKMDEAIEQYQIALGRLGDDPVILNDLGLCLARSDRATEAVAVLKKALAGRPDSLMYRNNLAAVLVQAGENQAAVNTLQETHGPVVAHYNVAYLLNRRGDVDNAYRHFDEALKVDPNFDPARKMLNQMAPQIGRRPMPEPDTINNRLSQGGRPVTLPTTASQPNAPVATSAMTEATVKPVTHEKPVSASIVPTNAPASIIPSSVEAARPISIPGVTDGMPVGVAGVCATTSQVSCDERQVMDEPLGLGLPDIRMPSGRRPAAPTTAALVPPLPSKF